MELKLGKDIAWELLDAERTCAIILYDDQIYEDDNNHQACFQTIFKNMNFNLDDEKEMAEAIRMTDEAFRNEELHGFDIWEHKNGKYLIAHYPQALENKTVFRIMYEYATTKGLCMATYTDRTRLGDECHIVLNKLNN